MWKQWAKSIARSVSRLDSIAFARRVTADAGDLCAEETDGFSPDMLIRQPCFGLKLDPDLDYLRWRYSTHLSHVRHRIFQLRSGGATCGYVVLSEWPHCLVVAHCDGDDPAQLARGILLSIAAANRGKDRYRQVLVATMHPVMGEIFRRFGFRPNPTAMPLYLASFGRNPIPDGPGTDWLVSMDLGDQGIAAGLLDARSRLRILPAAPRPASVPGLRTGTTS